MKNVPISHRINTNKRGTRKSANDKSMCVESSTIVGVGLSTGCSVGLPKFAKPPMQREREASKKGHCRTK